MLRYFSINDPYRFIAVVLLLVGIRCLFYFTVEGPGTDDLYHLLVGEKTGEGLWFFTDINTQTPLLAGLVWGGLDLLFGKSFLAHHIFSMVLIVFQAFLVNSIVNNNKATTEQTYFPSLLYVLFCSSSPAMYSLTRELMGTTFILLAVNYLFQHMEFRVKRDEKMLGIGFLIGLSSLFFQGGILFMVGSLLILGLFTRTLFRRYLLVIFGFFLPYLVMSCFYIYKGDYLAFLIAVTSFPFSLGAQMPNWIVLSAPLFLMVFSLPVILQTPRLTNFQNTLLQTMLLWTILTYLLYYLGPAKGETAYLMFGLPFSFFGSHYLILKRKGWLKNVVFYLFFVVHLAGNVLVTFSPEILSPYYTPAGAVKSGKWKDFTKGKKILVLGPGLSEYVGASHGSFFFEWELCEDLFNSTPSYGTIARVYDGIIKDPPQLIIDENGLLEKFIVRIPALEKEYKKSSKGPFWVKVE